MLEGRNSQICSIWRTLVIFPKFRDRVIKVSSFCPPKKDDFLSANFKFFCVRMDASRCLKVKSAENVFTLTKFGFFPLLCVKVIKVHFGHRQNFAFSGKNWLYWEGMDATRWFKAKIEKNVFTLTIFGDFFHCFAIDSSKLVCFGHIQKFALFGKKWLSLGKNGCN